MDEPEPVQDTGRSISTVTAFGFALGSSTLVYPLLALDTGIAAPVVGLLTAISGAAQLTTRFALPWLLERVPDRTLIVTAALCLALSGATLWLSTTLAAFVTAQVLQGTARALFWTSSQTHVVRSRGVPIRKLAQVQTASHVGALAGPAIAGILLTQSVSLAIGLVVAAALAGVASGCLLAYKPPYDRRPRRGHRTRLWRQRRIALGCWTSFAAGGWRGLFDSFVPIVLATAGLSAATVGWLMATAEGAVVAVSVALAKFGRERSGRLIRVAGIAVLGGAAVLPLVAQWPVLAALALVIAAAGGGLAGSLGPAIVNAHVAPNDQGTAIALAGTYRAAARMATPAVLAAAGGVVGVGVAMAVAAVGIAAPVLALDKGDDGSPPP